MSNRISVFGRLTKDIELKSYGNEGKQMAKFTVASDDGYGEQKKSSFFDCTLFGSRAETLEKNVGKGCEINVHGRMEQRTYEKDGEKRTAWGMIVENFDIIEWKAKYKEKATQQEPAPEGFENLDEDVPF